MRQTVALLVAAAAAAGVVALAAPAPAAEADWDRVGQVFGREAVEQAGGVRRISLPRTDLTVTVGGVRIEPALALGSWLAFHPAEGGRAAMVMGDLVLTEVEVNPVMKRLAERGIEVTALHNHLLRAEPATMYMHVAGRGDPVEMAQALRAALEQSETPMAAKPATGRPEAGPKLDKAALERVLGREAKASGTVLQFSVPRAEPISDGGMRVPPSMGTGIAINFQPAGDGRAATTGDFVLRAEEVNPVLRTLREHGIEVTALHNHMLEEEPRLFFMHFWGVDDPEKLAQGLRAALEKVKVAKGDGT